MYYLLNFIDIAEITFFLLVFIIQILVLIKSLKTQQNKFWLITFCIEIFSALIGIAVTALLEYSSKDMSNLSGYIIEESISIIFVMLYLVMLIISFLTKLIFKRRKN